MNDFLFPSIYYYSFDIAALLNSIVVIAFFIALKQWNMLFFRTKLFRLMLINSVVSDLLDIFTAYFNTTGNCRPGQEAFFTVGGYVSNYLYLSVHNFQAVLFLLYALSIGGSLTPRTWKKRALICYIPYFIDIAVLTIGLFNGSTISYSLEEGYRHGPLFPLVYVIGIGYMAAVAWSALHYRRALLTRDLVSITAIAFGVVFAVLLQLVLGDVLIELYLQSLILIIILIAIEDQDVLYDPKTGCFNVQGFKEQTEAVLRSGKERELVVVKAVGFSYFTKFRSVEEGERAKKSIAAWISEQTDSEYIFDCENDVLVTYVDPRTQEEVDAFHEGAIETYRNWPFRDMISLQMAHIRIPEEADQLSSILLFLQSDFKDNKLHPHRVAEEEVLAIRRKSEVERAVMRGTEKGRIRTVFQPIMDRQGKLHAAEALSRMNDEILGNVPPFEFITAAENNGLIWQLGLNTLEESCRLLHDLPEDLRPDYVEVNLSTVQCVHGGCLEAFMEILNRYGVAPGRINFEITESAMIRNIDTFNREKAALTEAGFSFSIDDYGSGFSNYSYLKSVLPECVKFDRDALLDADREDREARYYVDMVHAMHDLGYRVVAEGVETKEQLAFVLSAGVDYIQGFYYSRPVGPEDFIAYAKKTAGDGQ